MLIKLLRRRLGRNRPSAPAAAVPESLFRRTAPMPRVPPASSISTLQPVTESYARMRLTCAETQKALALGKIKTWSDFESSLSAIDVDHLIIAGENGKGQPVWTSWLRNRRDGEIVPCVSVYRSFTMRSLAKSLGPHPKWAPLPPAVPELAPTAPGGAKFIVTADDEVVVGQGALRVSAGIGIGDLPPGTYALDLDKEGLGSVLIHEDGARVYFDPRRQPLKVTASRTSTTG